MCEFFTFENEVWFRLPNGSSDRLTEKHTDIISSTLDRIEKFYPKAYPLYAKNMNGASQIFRFFRFRIVSRFCKCNFGNIDNIQDIDEFGRFNFEFVSCPLRGECRYEQIICHPEFDHRISAAEMRVLRLWYHGKKKDDIAEELYLSVHTVNNHIRNAFTRLGIHDKSEFVKYAEANNLFK